MDGGGIRGLVIIQASHLFHINRENDLRDVFFSICLTCNNELATEAPDELPLFLFSFSESLIYTYNLYFTSILQVVKQ